MRRFIIWALVGASIGLGAAALSAPAPDFTVCRLETVFEDGSFTMSCPPAGGIEDLEADIEPDFEPDFWEQLDLMRDLEGVEYA